MRPRELRPERPRAHPRLAAIALIALGVGVGLTPTAAYAETSEQLVAQGEELARGGRLSDAIERFKAADRIAPRARHACLIALAYTRRELWSQADVFLQLCHERATPADPLPDWVPLAVEEMTARLRTANVAPVEIVVEPADRTARIAVSSFLPDELFEPRTIHLPVGRHLITATIGGRLAQQTIEIADRSPLRVVVRFDAASAAATRRSRTVPWTIAGVGAAVLAGGAAYHAFALRPVRNELERAGDPQRPDPARYDRYSSSFDTRRTVTVAMYGIGAAAVITGVVLRYSMYRDAPESATQVTARFVDGGAMVGLELRR